MNLNDLYEMRDPRDAYERDVANSTSGFGKDSQAYRADGGANDENHALDQQSSTWYIRLNGKLIRDKSGNPYAFQDKAAANKAARTMQAKLFNKDKEFMLTTNPNDKSQGMSEMWGNPYDDDKVDAINAANPPKISGTGTKPVVPAKNIAPAPRQANTLDHDAWDKFTRGVAEVQGQPLTVQQLATISDAALDKAYGYGRSQPGNSFGWQANLKSAAFAKQMIDKGVTDIEAISDAIHKGWNTTAQAFVQNPEQFDDTAKLKAAGKLEAKLQQRAQLMKQNYGQLPEEEKEKDRVVARALLQALKKQGVAEAPGAETLGHNQSTVASNLNSLDLDEGWKEKLGAAALAGSMALGSAGAQARVMPGADPSINRLTGKPNIEQPAPSDIKPAVQAPAGYSKEYLQKAADPNRLGRYMISVEKAQELLKNMQGDLDEGDKKPKEEKYGPEYDDMVARVKKLAGLGPMKTVYDPAKRVYRNVPTAVQPKK